MAAGGKEARTNVKKERVLHRHLLEQEALAASNHGSQRSTRRNLLFFKRQVNGGQYRGKEERDGTKKQVLCGNQGPRTAAQ